jgi:hypothetical protein
LSRITSDDPANHLNGPNKRLCHQVKISSKQTVQQ